MRSLMECLLGMGKALNSIPYTPEHKVWVADACNPSRQEDPKIQAFVSYIERVQGQPWMHETLTQSIQIYI